MTLYSKLAGGLNSPPVPAPGDGESAFASPRRTETDITFASLTGETYEPRGEKTTTFRADTKTNLDDSESPTRPPLQSQPSMSSPRIYKGFNYKRRIFYHEYWFLESFALSCAIGFFCFYIVLLVVNDDKPVEGWEYRRLSGLSTLFRNLPSFLAFLSTVMRGLMLYPIAASMGQLKWHYFRRGQMLSELENVDQATRGVAGSFKLIFSRGIFRWVTVGALLIVSTVFSGVFIQNAVDQRIKLVELSTEEQLRLTQLENPDNSTLDAVFPGLFGWPLLITPDGNDAQEFYEPPHDVGVAARMGWYHWGVTQDNQGSALPTKCSTGDCSWKDMTSLAVLTECAVADDVEVFFFEDQDLTYYYSSQADIAEIAPRSTNESEWILTDFNVITRPLVPTGSAWFEEDSKLPVLAHVAAMSTRGGVASVADCVVYWAGIDYDSPKADPGVGELEIREVHKEAVDPVVYGGFDDIHIDPGHKCRFNTSSTNEDDWTDCNLYVSWAAHRALQNMLGKLLTFHSAEIRVETGEDKDEEGSLAWEITAPEVDALWWSFEYELQDYRERTEEDKQTHDDIKDLFVKVMTGHLTNTGHFMSNSFRGSKHWGDHNIGRVDIFGTVRHSELYFRVMPFYAMYPGIMLALAVVFYAVTIWRTRRETVWKNSQLAVLYHGLMGAEAGSPSENLDTLASMSGLAEQVPAVLRWEHDALGWRLREWARPEEIAPLVQGRGGSGSGWSWPRLFKRSRKGDEEIPQDISLSPPGHTRAAAPPSPEIQEINIGPPRKALPREEV